MGRQQTAYLKQNISTTLDGRSIFCVFTTTTPQQQAVSKGVNSGLSECGLHLVIIDNNSNNSSKQLNDDLVIFCLLTNIKFCAKTGKHYGIGQQLRNNNTPTDGINTMGIKLFHPF